MTSPAAEVALAAAASSTTRSSCRLILGESNEPNCRYFWALTVCAHCRDYTSCTCVFTCYTKIAHHREVMLVDSSGAREGVAVLSEGQDLPLPVGNLGKILVLDQNVVDNVGVRCVVSCEACAGLPLGGCIDAEHEQQVTTNWCLAGPNAVRVVFGLTRFCTIKYDSSRRMHRVQPSTMMMSCL